MKTQLNPRLFPDVQEQIRAAKVRMFVLYFFLALLIAVTFLAGVASGQLLQAAGVGF